MCIRDSSTGQGGEGHNEHAGAHGGLQLVAQHTGEDEQHHHAVACADEAAAETDEHTAHDGLDGTLFGADTLHRDVYKRQLQRLAQFYIFSIFWLEFCSFCQSAS